MIAQGMEKFKKSKTKAEVQKMKGESPAIFCNKAAPSPLSFSTKTTNDAERNENPRIMFSATMNPLIILLQQVCCFIIIFLILSI